MDSRNTIVVLILVFACIAFPKGSEGQTLGVLQDSLDSKKSNLVGYSDSLKVTSNRLDSVGNNLQLQLDSATRQFNIGLAQLKDLNLSSNEYASKLDSSYNHFQEHVIHKFKNTYDSLGMKTDARLSQLDSAVTSKTHFLDSLLSANKIKGISERFEFGNKFKPDINLPSSSGVNVSALNAGGNLSLPSTTLTNSISASQQLNIKNNLNVGDIEKVKDLQGELKDGLRVTDNIKTISKNSDKIKSGEASKELEKSLENQVLKRDELKALKDQQKAADALKEQVESVKKAASKDSLQSIAKKEFVDHFAGKEEILKKDLDDIAKVQMKYGSFADARFLPKRPPNEMKGKPFVERLIPGLSFQVFRGDNTAFDIAPFIGYRFSGHISAGVSAYRRLTYTEKHASIKIRNEDLLGLRFYGDVKILRGVFVHSEYQLFRDRSSIANKIPAIETNKGWQSKFNFGLYRTYKISKNISGNMVLLYDLLRIREFPNTRNVAMRFGFEYRIKKKLKKGN
jgi:hypothetical protein